MTATLVHRGPDDDGVAAGGGRAPLVARGPVGKKAVFGGRAGGRALVRQGAEAPDRGARRRADPRPPLPGAFLPLPLRPAPRLDLRTGGEAPSGVVGADR